MINKKVERVSAFSGQDRMAYFIRKVADFEAVWGAFENGWIMLGSDFNKHVIPLWPEKCFAQAWIDSKQLTAKPKKIDIALFLNRWVVGMEKDQTKICVFPVAGMSGVVIDSTSLSLLIQEEMNQYE